MMEFTHIANPVRVTATRIEEVTDITKREPGRGQSHPDLMLRLADGRNYTATSDMSARYVPVAGDYLVRQEDGYEYLNPKDVFERKYRVIGTGMIVSDQGRNEHDTGLRVRALELAGNLPGNNADGLVKDATKLLNFMKGILVFEEAE